MRRKLTQLFAKVFVKQCRDVFTTYAMDDDGDLIKTTTVWTWKELFGERVTPRVKQVYYELPIEGAALNLEPVKPIKI